MNLALTILQGDFDPKRGIIEALRTEELWDWETPVQDEAEVKQGAYHINQRI